MATAYIEFALSGLCVGLASSGLVNYPSKFWGLAVFLFGLGIFWSIQAVKK